MGQKLKSGKGVDAAKKEIFGQSGARYREQSAAQWKRMHYTSG